MEHAVQPLKRARSYWLCIVALLVVHGCSTVPPHDTRNVCSIFREHPDWYLSAKRTSQRWGVPISMQMAIMRYESHFDSDARPPREMLFGLIPGDRPSTAYGYAQALDGTWSEYQRETGNHHANRDDFKDASDFIGWYASKAKKKAKIRSTDGYHLYLAYHDGIAGYLKGTYHQKKWLLNVAKNVQRTFQQYQAQLNHCAAHIEKSNRWISWL